jgi:MtN3 and saliva related transmembrane protein
MVTVLGVLAALFGLVMALAPVLQIRRMWQRRSSDDVSVGFFAVLLPGFALWVAYGTAREDWFLVVPNVIGLLVGCTTIVIATLLRRHPGAPAPAPPG